MCIQGEKESERKRDRERQETETERKRETEFNNFLYSIIYQLYSNKIKLKKNNFLSSHCSSVVMNLTSTHDDEIWIPGLTQWVKNPALL